MLVFGTVDLLLDNLEAIFILSFFVKLIPSNVICTMSIVKCYVMCVCNVILKKPDW